MSILKNVGIKHGSEGPRHDPYSYIEFRWTKGDRVVVLHQGLANWVEVGGIKHEGSGATYQSLPVEIFEKETGLSVDEIYQAMHEGDGERVICEQCTSKDIEWVNGHPGEKFLQCNSCGHVLITDFNEGAII